MTRLAQLQRLWDADSSDPDIAYMIAQEHLRAADHARAVEWFDRCLAADPDYLYAYYHKARAQHAAGLPPDARATLATGLARAAAAPDPKAASELQSLLDQLND